MGLRKLVVFNLPETTDERDVEDIFAKYGKLMECSIRRQGDSNMAFLEYSESRDAEDAIRERHGWSHQGNRIRVEFSQPKGGKGKGKRYSSRDRNDSRGRSKGGSKGGYGKSPAKGGYGKGGRGDSRGRKGGGKEGGGKAGLKDSYFKVRVMGMPASASWQDLKDFLRAAGTVKFTEIVEPGVGIGGYMTHNEARDAVLDLDSRKFTARNGDTAHVQLDEEKGGRGGGGAPPRRGRSRSPQRSRSRGRGRSYSRSR